MNKNGLFIKEKLQGHFKENAISYYISGFVVLIGIIIGVYLVFTGYSYTSLLSASDKNIIEYIKGTASYSDIFYFRMMNICVSFVILIIFNLSVYTSFLGYIYLGYQVVLTTLMCSALITLYGLAGVLNVCLFTIPINLIYIFIMVFVIAISVGRARYQKKYRVGFWDSFKESEYFKFLILAIVFAFLLCVVFCFVFPLFLKSFVMINY